MVETGKTALIEGALHYRLSELVLSPARRVAWPDNDIFVPDTDEIYLVPSIFFNRTDFAAVGSNAPRRHRGLYQVIVKGPKNKGVKVQGEICDLIIEHFVSQNLERGGVRVRVGASDGGPSIPSRSQATSDDVWRNTPITIPWWADTFET